MGTDTFIPVKGNVKTPIYKPKRENRNRASEGTNPADAWNFYSPEL